MFFPFLNYETFNYTHFDQTPIHVHTIGYRCLCIVELLDSNANDPNKGVWVYADNLGYVDDPFIPTLLRSGRGTLHGGALDIQPDEPRGSFPIIFTQAGARIWFARGDIYGQSQIKLHIFRLPDL